MFKVTAFSLWWAAVCRRPRRALQRFGRLSRTVVCQKGRIGTIRLSLCVQNDNHPAQENHCMQWFSCSESHCILTRGWPKTTMTSVAINRGSTRWKALCYFLCMKLVHGNPAVAHWLLYSNCTLSNCIGTLNYSPYSTLSSEVCFVTIWNWWEWCGLQCSCDDVFDTCLQQTGKGKMELFSIFIMLYWSISSSICVCSM